MQHILATATALSALVAQAPAPANLPVVATGMVRSADGQPVAGALVQQEGSVTSAFTNASGGFRLLLDKTGGRTLTVSAVGYEAETVPIDAGKDLAVTLRPITGFLPATPDQAFVPVGTATRAETAPLNSGLQFAYRVRSSSLAAGNASLGGIANNDFRLGARFRWRPWLLEAEGGHFQYPVDVAGLGRDENPAFSPSVWQAGARIGMIFPLRDDVESALAVGYRWNSTVPNNNDIPFTGSPLDFEQNRHALGGVGTLGWRPNRGPWHFEAQAGLYPVVLASAEAPGVPYGSSFMTDIRTTVGYEIVRGMRIGAGYQLEDWRGGAGTENAHLLTINMHYTPGGVPAGDEK